MRRKRVLKEALSCKLDRDKPPGARVLPLLRGILQGRSWTSFP